MADEAAPGVRSWRIAGAIVLLAIGLRTAGMARETPWHDEVLTLRFIDAPTLGEYMDLVLTNDEGVRPFPIYFVVQYAWAKVVGPPVLSLRLLSVTCSIATLLLFMQTARTLYGERIAWIAGALFAVSLPHIYFAQEIRFYAFTTLLVALSSYGFVRAVHSGRRIWWMLNIGVNSLLPWTHVYAPLVWLAQGAALLLFFREHRRLVVVWVCAHMAICVAFAIWMLRLEYVIEDEYVKQATPTYRELLNAFNVYAGGRFGKLNPSFYLPTGFSLDRLLTIGFALLVLALGADLYVRWRSAEASAEERFAFVFALFWLIGPPLFLFALSQTWKPLFVFRYTLYSSLGLYILAGQGLVSLRHTWARSLFAALLIVIFANQLTVLAQPFRPDYEAADAFIRSEAGAEAQVFVLKELNGIPFRYNSELPEAAIVVHEGLFELLASVETYLSDAPRAWIVFWQWDDFKTIEFYFAERNIATRRHTFAGIPPLVIYAVGQPASL